ncbi:MAG: TetR/AcrR family transcriptional regulator [Rhodospirillales bacterium]|jgi:AcrR family transcriptional regulator
MADILNLPVSQKKKDGQTLLIEAASEMLAEQPPSNISSRRLAKRAGVHHTLMNYTHGSIAELLAAAYRQEKSNFNDVDIFETTERSPSFPLAGYPNYWRAYVYLTLDAFKPELEQELVRGHSIGKAAATLQERSPDMSSATIDALAATWWSLQIGALVFEKPFSQGLSISLRHRDLVQELAAKRLDDLFASTPNDIQKRDIPNFFARQPKKSALDESGREAVENKLVQAAIELLKERADTGISGRELAQRAEVNYGLIHHYFGSKEAVFDKAFVDMHELYVQSRIVDQDHHLAEPFSMITHEPFFRNWAYRELAGIGMPPIDLIGQRLLLDDLCERHGIERRSGRAFAEVQADAYCSLSVQLGWVLCRQNLLKILDTDELVLLGRMTNIVDWFITRQWR